MTDQGKRDMDDPVSLAPLTLQEALSGLLAVDPDAEPEDATDPSVDDTTGDDRQPG